MDLNAEYIKATKLVLKVINLGGYIFVFFLISLIYGSIFNIVDILTRKSEKDEIKEKEKEEYIKKIRKILVKKIQKTFLKLFGN